MTEGAIPVQKLNCRQAGPGRQSSGTASREPEVYSSATTHSRNDLKRLERPGTE